ncbi:hypothetical protein OIO90_004401 [Microbotryomycetes sp. JL221]|nr:hypothetical protein OIO90_004401 [Microbotryomycetes sp. JL221]
MDKASTKELLESLPAPATTSDHAHQTRNFNKRHQQWIIVMIALVALVTWRTGQDSERSGLSLLESNAPPRSSGRRSKSTRLTMLNTQHAQQVREHAFGCVSTNLTQYKHELASFLNLVNVTENLSSPSSAESSVYPSKPLLEPILDCFLDPECDTHHHKIPSQLFATDQIVEPLPLKLQQWRNMNIDSTLVAWNDSQVSEWVSATFGSSSIISNMYRTLPLDILKFDMFRLLALLVHGGTYTDADTEPMRPIQTWSTGAVDVTDSMLRSDDSDQMHTTTSTLEVDGPSSSLIVAVEWVGDVEHNQYNSIYSRDVGIVQWTFSAHPGHPVILDALRQLVRHTELVTTGAYESLKGTDAAIPFDPEAPRAVLEWSGPALLTNALARYLQTRWAAELSQIARHSEPIRVGDVVLLPLASMQARSSIITRMFDWFVSRNLNPLSTRWQCVKHAHAASWWSQKLQQDH